MADKVPQAGRIRQMTAADLDLVLEWRNHPSVRRSMFTQHEITPPEHRSWFERNSSAPGRSLLIFERDNSPLGFVSFFDASGSQVAEWGFYAAPDAPSGTGRAMGMDALRFAFESLHLHKVCGQVLSENTRSIRYHVSLNFTIEGTLRQHRYDGHNYHDVVCFGMLRDEWRVHNPR